MSNKSVTLVTRYWEEKSKLNVCTWTPKQQQEFVNTVYGQELQDCDHWCVFDIEFDNTIIYQVSSILPPMQWWQTDVQKRNHDDEFLISLRPSIQPANYPVSPTNGYCKCGIRSEYECPKCIQNGKCTSPFIRKMIGAVLFPAKYK